MIKNKTLIFLLIISIFTGKAFANSISIICFQNDGVDKLCKSITQEFEDTLFEPFFDNGFIVTSIPTQEISSKNNINLNELKKNFEEPTDFAIIAYMEYDKDLIFDKKLNKLIPNWKKLNISLLNFSNEKEILQKNINLAKIKERNPKKKAKQIAIEITKEILNTLNKSKGE